MLPCFRVPRERQSRAVEFRFPRAETEEGFYLENGGLVLEHLITSFDGKYSPFRIFSKRELYKATNEYCVNGILHEDFKHSLYRGTLDGREICVKKFLATSSRIHKTWCINEVAVVSQLSKHKNVLKLLGCCLETEIPTLVYEFARNGSLSDHILDGRRRLSWKSRLSVASEAAHAVAYLHNVTPDLIVHRDINSRNILLDGNFVPKLFEFGFSVPIPMGEKHVDAEVVGDVGFIAPESLNSGRYTEKSDVYSFGSVLLEILTGKSARNMVPEWNCRGESSISNAKSGNWTERERNTESYLKGDLAGEGDKKQQMECAEIAVRCLKMNADERPTMIEVSRSLREIRRLGSKAPQHNVKHLS
ncbi:hypothetical protein I3760_07G130700 [Carya illinoinensis]|uniref:Protein kinase domain-containing protein n=1 Tax=Carya illinoinensis TaxID=32201 RepID=A0A8T1PVJ9_CARIL|nr:non-functional pseudokinase ZED1-like [Carya illinoinensis]KAG2698002.1 hypothetical protein I3760_07G130700 [Carya illinoinensis]KAG6648206.1 hypothetical protein CIPAW_07G131700 [Carya illinoinensis]